MIDAHKSAEMLYERMLPMLAKQNDFDIVRSKYGYIATLLEEINLETGECDVYAYLLDDFDSLLDELFCRADITMSHAFCSFNAICEMPAFMAALVYPFIKGLPDEEYALHFLRQYLQDRCGKG